MLAYKGFDKGLICRDYQFNPGLNVTEKANCAKNGFHCAENPLDCFNYYPNIKNSEYYIVDAGGDIDEDERDSKISCTHLTILTVTFSRIYKRSPIQGKQQPSGKGNRQIP